VTTTTSRTLRRPQMTGSTPRPSEAARREPLTLAEAVRIVREGAERTAAARAAMVANDPDSRDFDEEL
jgi:hypothetical protein